MSSLIPFSMSQSPLFAQSYAPPPIAPQPYLYAAQPPVQQLPLQPAAFNLFTNGQIAGMVNPFEASAQGALNPAEFFAGRSGGNPYATALLNNGQSAFQQLTPSYSGYYAAPGADAFGYSGQTQAASFNPIFGPSYAPGATPYDPSPYLLNAPPPTAYYPANGFPDGFNPVVGQGGSYAAYDTTPYNFGTGVNSYSAPDALLNNLSYTGTGLENLFTQFASQF